MRKNKGKGFLGPIGDDLPSLIPLIFALTIFFYAFTSTWNVFDQRDTSFDSDIAVLRISYALKGDNYIASDTEFHSMCETAKGVSGMWFFSGLLELSTGPESRFKGINIDRLLSEGQGFFPGFLCSNTEQKPDLEENQTLVRFFPIALEFEDQSGMFYVKPMLLVVVAWQ
ncbi:MAG: hypothetical protein JW744_03790 [Candidatus Diapherotrites archaeon]|uniref:Uncharacterized protein n=1 Tax=Candidatus Iainarchaeum sp. TaxID=3101447 RepID=A0A939C6L0_9ARCH|nr:hypothetical protein [Candidatus Diapherotrites archaeon]